MNLKTNPNDSIFMDGNGMTKREFFAAMALQGLMSGLPEDIRVPIPSAVTRDSVELADALIESLNAVKNDVLEK